MKNVGKGLVLAGLMLFSFSSSAQIDPSEAGEASITADYCVSLNDAAPIQNIYALDISHLGLESEYMAQKKFGHINNNLLTYHVDFDNNKVYLEVHIDRVDGEKDVMWWNDYLSSLCSK